MRILLTLITLFIAVVNVEAKVFSAVSLDLNKQDGVFQKGEKIVFTGKLLEDVEETLMMTVYKNGLPVDTMPVKLSQESSVIYECSSDKAASVIVKVELASDAKACTAVGAVVAPEEFTPGFDEPSDFMKYWKAQVKCLRRFKSETKLTPVELPAGNDDYKAFALEITMPEGNPVRGYLVMPAEAKKKSHPVVIFAHGAGVVNRHTRASVETALKHAKMGSGAISLDINAHGFLDDQPDEYYKKLSKRELRDYQKRPLATRDDYYFRLMFLRLVRATDYLCSLPEWDKERLAVLGESQGGLQCAAIAGLDKRVKLAIITCPAHTDLGAPRQGRMTPWPGIYDIAQKSTPELIDGILPYFDGANFLRHYQGKLVTEVGFTDVLSPPSCVYAGYNVCPAKEKVIYSNAHRPHKGSDTHPVFYDAVKKIESEKNRILADYLK